MPSVLFVCTANRFRSPVAAAIFEKALLEDESQKILSWNIDGLKDWKIGSAGVWALNGQAVLPDVMETAKQLGFDLSSHRSLQLNASILSEYDLILVMQEDHKKSLEKEFPDAQERIYLFSNVVDTKPYDIPDAYESIQEIVGVVAGMNELIQRNLRYICVLAVSLHNKRTRSR